MSHTSEYLSANRFGDGFDCICGPTARDVILANIEAERKRQVGLLAAGKIKIPCELVSTTNQARLPVLAEEFGEVAKEVCEQQQGNYSKAKLRAELIQTAAVCVAWIEGLDAESEES